LGYFFAKKKFRSNLHGVMKKLNSTIISPYFSFLYICSIFITQVKKDGGKKKMGVREDLTMCFKILVKKINCLQPLLLLKTRDL
jgi:hypothetical protein